MEQEGTQMPDLNESLLVGQVVGTLLADSTLKKATKFITPQFTVKATRQHKYDGRAAQQTFLVTIGKPNYAERSFIKLAKMAGESFPIKKIQLK